MNYLELIKFVLDSEVEGNTINLAREEYFTVYSRASKIIDFHILALGPIVCWLSLFSFISLGTKFRRHIIFAFILCALTWAPYLVGHTLRDYWFVPTYLLVSVLACITVSTVLKFLDELTWNQVVRRFYLVGIVVCLGGGIYLSVKNHIHTFLLHSNLRPSNKEMSKQWLEKHHLGNTPILLDKHFFWTFPKLYDSAFIGLSRDISQLFTYERKDNRFLASVFESRFYGNNLSYEKSALDTNSKLFNLRVDFHKTVSEFGDASICSYFSQNCLPLTIKNTNDLELFSKAKSQYKVAVKGKDPFVEYEVNRFLSGDGGHYLKIDTDARNVELYYDTGQGYSEDNKSAARTMNRLLTIRHIRRRPWVNKIGVGEFPSDKVDTSKRVLFVTSPSVYLRLQNVYEKEAGSSKAELAKSSLNDTLK